MSNGWVLPEDVLRDAPAYAPRTGELADLELLLSGAFAYQRIRHEVGGRP